MAGVVRSRRTNYFYLITGGTIMDYKNSGVDIEAGYESVELMKKYVKGI